MNAIPTRNQLAYTTANSFIDHVISVYDIPNAILTDRCRNFTSHLFKNNCEYFGVDRKFTTAYHPQMDGQTERFNRTLMGVLRNYIGHKRDDWEDVLELVCFAYRASFLSSIRETPYFPLHGRDPPYVNRSLLRPTNDQHHNND